MPRVKGLAFRSVLQAHRTLRGSDAIERVYAQLEPGLAQTLRAPLAATWYPLSSYAALWDAIQQTAGQNADYPRVVGRLCAEQDLRTVHKVLFATLSTSMALSATARLFSSYYDTGTCSCKRCDPRTFQFSFQGCLEFTEPMWTELRGSAEVFLELSTKKDAHSRLLSGGRAGDKSCVVEVRW